MLTHYIEDRSWNYQYELKLAVKESFDNIGNTRWKRLATCKAHLFAATVGFKEAALHGLQYPCIALEKAAYVIGNLVGGLLARLVDWLHLPTPKIRQVFAGCTFKDLSINFHQMLKAIGHTFIFVPLLPLDVPFAMILRFANPTVSFFSYVQSEGKYGYYHNGRHVQATIEPEEEVDDNILCFDTGVDFLNGKHPVAGPRADNPIPTPTKSQRIGQA